MNAKNILIRIVAAVALAASLSPALAESGGFPLAQFPKDKLNDLPALQRGAKMFVNYCMGCHSANSMRYNRLRDIGLTEEQIKNNLIFTQSKVGGTMTIPMLGNDAKEWFGALPPDLSVGVRARSSGAGSGSDWLYTFLRSFYRDSSRPTGWNNALFPNVGMPHVLWQLQGQRGAKITDIRADGHGDGHGGSFKQMVSTTDVMGLTSTMQGPVTIGHPHAGKTFEFGQPSGGQLNSLDYDDAVADLVGFLTYVSDPSAKTRTRLGVWVLVFLGLLFWAAMALNRAYWKDIK